MQWQGRPYGGAEASCKAISRNTPPREDRPMIKAAGNGAKARTCLAMPRDSGVEKLRIAFSMRMFLGHSVL